MELAAMFRLEKKIIPVFFYVEPSHVSHQSGPFEMAFSTHEKGCKDVKEWRKAMTEVGKLKGFVLNHQSNKKEKELIQEIVERVGGCRNDVLPVAEHPVGIESRVEQVMELLSIEEGGIKMVGIYGMGGVGKTTLAKEIYNRLHGRFEKAIYIEGIKDKKDRLPELQEEFISKAFEKIKIHNSTEGEAEIKKRFPQKRVLAVLDDVDHRKQLNALAGGCHWFGEGTRILITTRDVQLLDAHHVTKMYQVHELNSIESLHLFSRHAFNNDQPSEEFMEISKKIAKAVGGLPLALEVLGSKLSEKTDKEEWEEVEARLRGSKYHDIDQCLRISYDGLSQNEQKGFLDIACFFLRVEKDEVIDIWKGCDFDDPVSTVNSLLHKCLLKVDDYGQLYMHDLLRDMGRNIVKADSPDVASRSRLWDQKEVWDVLEEKKGTNQIKGVICKRYMEGEQENVPEQVRESVDVEAFANMSNLELLLLEKTNLKGDFSRMPRSLRSLKWTGCSMQTLPDNFNIQKIRCLKLLHSTEIVQFWSDSCISKEKVFTNLKVLELRNCSQLKKLPDFSRSLDLEKLCLHGCTHLTDIPDFIGNLTKLKMIDLTFCDDLQCLPNSIGRLRKLEHLGLRDCRSLSRLPDSIENLTRLRKLDVYGCESLLALPNSIGNLTGLEELPFRFCTSLSTLPPIGNLTRLKSLETCYCKRLSALPNSIGSLTGLESLVLTHCRSLMALPDSIGNLTRLEYLDLARCTSLSTLPDSIGYLSGLRKLNAAGCQSLLALPDSIENLTGLKELNLGSYKGLSTLPSAIGSIRRLSTLVLSNSSIEELPDSVPLLESLEWLGIADCRLRSRLPLWEMKCLRGLVIGGECIEKDETDSEDDISDNDDGECKIPDGITYYCEQTQECRRIRYIRTWGVPVKYVSYRFGW